MAPLLVAWTTARAVLTSDHVMQPPNVLLFPDFSSCSFFSLLPIFSRPTNTHSQHHTHTHKHTSSPLFLHFSNSHTYKHIQKVAAAATNNKTLQRVASSKLSKNSNYSPHSISSELSEKEVKILLFRPGRKMKGKGQKMNDPGPD